MKPVDRLFERAGMGLERSGHRYDLWLLLGLAVILIGVGIGLRSPWPADEPRFALIARDMVDSGHWLIPFRGGEAYPDKPPLFMWMIAACYIGTGHLDIAFLLPSLLASLGTLALAFDLCRRLYSPRAALFAGLLLLATVQFVLQGRSAQIDATVAFWIMLGVYGLVRHMLQGPAWPWYFVAWVAMGLGVITKGVGFLPVLLFIPYLLARRKNDPGLSLHRPGLAATGPLLMLLAIALWLVPMLVHVAQSGDPALAAYRDNILFRQTATRYVHSLGHVKPFWYYLVNVIPSLWIPLCILLPWLVVRWTRDIRQGDNRLVLLLGWSLLTLLFFSLSPGKRGVYILPILPVVCVASGPYLDDILTRSRWPGRIALGLICLLAIAAATIAMAGFAGLDKLTARAAEAGVAPWEFFAGVALIALVAIIATSGQRRYGTWLFFITGFWLLLGTWGYVILEPVRSPKEMMVEIARTVPPGDELAIVAFREQLLLYVDRPVTHFGNHTPVEDQVDEAVRWLQESDGRWVLMPRRDSQGCFRQDRLIDFGIRHRDNWVLADADALNGQCRPSENAAPRFRSR